MPCRRIAPWGRNQPLARSSQSSET
jgi:hypothetical protein